ncbi:MAG: hypothetical protein IPP26_01450 [Flavobacteriales bacterium]|nr:hypothetical protein [Flavobacteriales bacterium]
MRPFSTALLLAHLMPAMAQDYTITTIAGTGMAGSTGNGASAANATVNYPQGIALAADGSLYFGQPADHTVRRIDASTGNMEHVAGIGILGYGGNGGAATGAGLAYPFGLAFNADGDLFIGERDAFRIRRISASDGTITTYAGTMSPGNNTEVPALSAALHAPMGVRFTASGDLLLSVIGNNYVRYIDADSMYLHAFAGNGTAAFAGDGGAALTASLNQPYDIAIASNGDVYIADINNACIRKVDAITGIITTVAGIGTGPSAYNGDGIPAMQATLGLPLGIAFDADDNLYICDANQSRIRKVDAFTDLISTIAGTATSGFNGDNISSSTAMISAPCGIVVDSAGRVIFADAANHRIRMLAPMDDIGVSDVTGTTVSISVYPSPASEHIMVNVLRGTAGVPIELIDGAGRLVYRVSGSMSGNTVLPVTDLAPGLYHVRVAGALHVPVVIAR